MAVYTDVSDEALLAFLADYDLGALHSFRGIAEGVSNSNFLLETDAGRFILTLYEARTETAQLPFFIALMEFLAGRGITCPRPVPNRRDAALGTLAGKPAALVTYLDGLSVRRPAAAHCRQAGEALSRLHLAGLDFQMRRPNDLSVEGWRMLARQAGTRADTIAPGLAALIDEELALFERHWPATLPAGVIHADYFPDNVFFLRDRLSGLIDFYFACTDAFAYDLAIALNAWAFEPDLSFNVTKSRALIAGYQSRRPLEAAEIEALPLLARGAALRFLLTRVVDLLDVPPGALVKPHDPLPYLKRLRFHQQVESAADLGFVPAAAAA